MPDEKRPSDPNTPPDDPSRAGDDLSASTIFVEMMRQAAARRAEMGLTPPTAPAEPRQPPQHVTKSDKRPATTPRAPEPPISSEPKPPTISEIPERPEHLPASRRARPRRETSTGDHPVVSPDDATPAPLSAPRENRALLSQPQTSNIDQSPQEAPVSAAANTPERPLEESRPRPTVRRMPPALVPQPVDDAEEEESDSENESAEAEDGEAIQEQRIRRVQRRKDRQFRRRAGMVGGFVRTAIIVIVAALMASTIFTWFTRPDFFNADVASNLEVARATGIYIAQPTALPTPNWLRKIGIVSGHRGPQSDPGAVCPDGLQEADINFAVAQIVVKNLRAQGYSVDLLDEFDSRLDNYQAAALVSIHANTCQDWGGEVVSGFLVAKAAARSEGGLDTLLSECIATQYGLITGLNRRTNLTIDMTDYHTFREIHPFTPAAIIELGFLLADREVLTTRQDDMGRAITEGILCFLQPQQPTGGVVTATPGEFIPTPTLVTPGP